ncbi:hypothetical protein HDU84_002683 [Entophlyctis sp. JEL0112]|nr:hypothetical protein HDU84_002683 [Entophlyctis sp. JEL0112]
MFHAYSPAGAPYDFCDWEALREQQQRRRQLDNLRQHQLQQLRQQQQQQHMRRLYEQQLSQQQFRSKNNPRQWKVTKKEQHQNLPSAGRRIPIDDSSDKGSPAVNGSSSPADNSTDHPGDDTLNTDEQVAREEVDSAFGGSGNCSDDEELQRKSLDVLAEVANSLRVEFIPDNDRGRWLSRLDELGKNLDVDAAAAQVVLGTRANRRLLEVEERLTKMLLTMDSVLSYGSDRVRDTRKGLIQTIQEMLDDIERVKAAAVEAAVRGSLIDESARETEQ